MAESSLPERSDDQVFEELRTTFANSADYYDYYRLRYSDSILDTLVEHTQLSSDAKILEIGSGTGIATQPIVERGYDVTCIEPGESLADIARQKLQTHSNVRWLVESFEDVDLPKDHFDLVYSAMALHWVKPEQRYARPYHTLKPGGFLTLLYTEPVIIDNPQQDVFMLAMTPLLQQYDLLPEDQLAGRRLNDITWAPQPEYTQEAHDLFTNVLGYVQPEHFKFTSIAFAGFLHTLSNVLRMPEERRYQFLHDVIQLIRNDFDNEVTIPYAETLFFLQKPEA